jgi:hypothetical protein
MSGPPGRSRRAGAAAAADRAEASPEPPQGPPPQGSGFSPALRSPLFFDVETDGVGSFRPPRQRVVQIAFVARPRGGGAATRYSALVRGAARMADGVPHAITPEACERDGVELAEAAGRLVEAAEACEEIVSHNADFDVGTVDRNLEDAAAAEEGCGVYSDLLARWRIATRPRPGGGRRPGSKTVVCTMRTWARVRGGKFPKLAELFALLHGSSDALRGLALHDAAADCAVLEMCCDEMFGRA